VVESAECLPKKNLRDPRLRVWLDSVRNCGSTNAKRDIPMYAHLYLQGRMNLDDLVSRKISLRDVNDGYAALKDGSLTRVVVTSF